MLKALVALFIIAHGLIHLMGFLKAFSLAELAQLKQPISKPSGTLWLCGAALFVGAAIAVYFGRDWWWMVAVPGILISQLLILSSWQDARFGTVANVLILIAAVIGFGVWNFQAMAKERLHEFLTVQSSPVQSLSGEMITGLPPVVQTWLQRSNVIGRQAIRSVRMTQRGAMRTTPKGSWMEVQAKEWFRTGQPGFVWIADVKAAPGIHLAGIDSYDNGRGRMLIKALSLYPVADAQGSTIDQGSMLRYLAEIVWFPSAALDRCITWEAAGDHAARATMTYQDVTASGVFTFDARGDVASFEARRYYDRPAGATLEDWFIRIDPAGFREFGGVRIPTRSDVTWKLKDGDFTWFTLEITDVRYNEAPL